MKHLNDKQIADLTKALKTEQEKVLAELKTVGRINPENPGDWEPVPKTPDGDTADEGDIADNIDDYEENSAILKNLEIRLNEIKAALARLEKGTYGICIVDNTPIEIERLTANPAAATCKAHMNLAGN